MLASGIDTHFEDQVTWVEVEPWSRQGVDYCESKKTYPSIYACPGFRLPTEA